jgi:hypothetical protein
VEVPKEVRQYKNIVTLTNGICIVNGVWYFMLSNAIKHALAIKEISVKITGVEQPETTESAKITGVYTVQAT